MKKQRRRFLERNAIESHIHTSAHRDRTAVKARGSRLHEVAVPMAACGVRSDARFGIYYHHSPNDRGGPRTARPKNKIEDKKCDFSRPPLLS